MTLHELAGVVSASLAVGLLVLATAPWHRRWSADHAGSGVQKHHHGAPPRIGLLPILAGCVLGIFYFEPAGQEDTAALFALLLACALPAALMGLLEDVTKRVRARWRLLAPALGCALAMGVLGAVIPALGVPGLDGLLAFWPVAALGTVLMVVGFTQAMNIVDGLNGFSAGLTVLMLAATAWAAHVAGDVFVMNACLTLAAAVLGFLMLNFPRGWMFLGDGGAYFLGYMLATLWILLLVRNPGAVSVFFVLAVAAHPTIETIFSIVRRRLIRKRPRPATAPDRLHLHTLIFRRRTRPLWAPHQRRANPWAMNALATALLLVPVAAQVLLASMIPSSALWGLAVMVLSLGVYLFQFYRVVAFKSRSTPRHHAGGFVPSVVGGLGPNGRSE